MVFSKRIIFPWPAAAAAAAEAVKEDPLISQKKSFCRVLETPVPVCRRRVTLTGFQRDKYGCRGPRSWEVLFLSREPQKEHTKHLHMR